MDPDSQCVTALLGKLQLQGNTGAWLARNLLLPLKPHHISMYINLLYGGSNEREQHIHIAAFYNGFI